jgi:hypothetical protein
LTQIDKKTNARLIEARPEVDLHHKHVVAETKESAQ